MIQEEKMQFCNFKKKTEVEQKSSKKIILVNLRESKEQIQKIGEINKKTNQISDFHQYKQNLKLSLSNKKEVFGIYNPMKFSLLAKNPNILCKNEDLFFIFFNLYFFNI
jgi:hypothetical protein